VSANVIVTGVAELDRALSQFETKVQGKYIRNALNKSIAKVEKSFKMLCPVGVDSEGNDTGVMRDATKRITPKKKRWEFKRALVIDRAKLMTLYFARYGRFPGRRKQDTEPFFYPAVVELGGPATTGQRPLRAALYGNEQQVKEEFVSQLRMAVASAGK